MKEIKKQWQTLLAGNNKPSAARLAVIDSNSELAMQKINIGDGFADLFESEPITESTQMTCQYKMLYDMALAYRTKGSGYYCDNEVSKRLMLALERLYQSRYGENEKNGCGWRSTEEYNWWDWQIGTPRLLIDILMLMDFTGEEQNRRYLSLFHALVPKPCMTGSNFLNICTELIGAAVLENDLQTLEETVKRAGGIFAFCDENKKEGYYADGSYLFHEHHAMNAAYGLEQLWSAAFLIKILHGTPFAFGHRQEQTAVSWLLDGQAPFVFNRGFMRCVMGRYPDGGKIGRERLLCAAADLWEICDDEQKKEVASLVAELTDGGDEYEKNISPQRCKVIRRIKKNNACAASYDRVFAYIDRIVHKRAEWAFAAAMSSKRIAGYECINGLDRYGFYHGDGMTQIMLKSDSGQYADGYWSKVNPYRISGVTNDVQKRYPVSVSLDCDYLSEEDFVGGVCIKDKAAAAAMRLRSFHCEDGSAVFEPDKINTAQCRHSCGLRARKAWFAFENAVAAVGCEITADDGFEVETTVDNRRMQERKIFTESGKNVSETLTDPGRWANYGNMLGYVFLCGGTVNARIRKGSEDFFELWFSHGKNPSDGTYAYVLLPNTNAEQTAEYAKKPEIDILSNTASVQCVYDKKSKTKVFVFYEAAEFDGISVSKPMLVMLREENGKYTAAASDPTQKTETAELTFNKNVRISGNHVSMAGNKIIIDFTKSGGASIEFDIIPQKI